MSRDIVIFGATGFIGSAIRARLGDEVRAPMRSDADLNDPASLKRVISEGTIVINAAGWAAATDRSSSSQARLRRDNIHGPVLLAQACAEVGASQLIHLSSVAAMGPVRGLNLTEAASTSPRSPYAESKFLAELKLQEVKGRPAITILRPTSVFGEGRRFSMTLCRLASLPVVPLPASGHALVPFTHVDNVAHSVALAVGNVQCHDRTFIVGDRTSYRLRDIIEGLSHALGHAPRFVGVPTAAARAAGQLESLIARARGRPPLLDEQRLRTLTESVSYSIEAFESATGYEPIVSLKEALARIGLWCRDVMRD